MNEYSSLAKFSAFVQLKDFRAPTKNEYVRYVRRLGDHYRRAPATLTEDQIGRIGLSASAPPWLDDLRKIITLLEREEGVGK